MTIKILLCTDGSKNALAAITLGGRIAAALKAETTLFAAGKRGHKVYRVLGRAAEILHQFGISPSTLVGIGSPFDQFISQVQRTGYDLVVIGYRKRGVLEKALIGCVAAQVAHEATTSVLVVRQGRPDIRKLLLGIGGDGFTTEIAEWGARIAAAVGAQVTLLHVGLAPPLMYGGLAEVQETLTELLETSTPAARALRQAAATMESAGIPAEIKIAYGVTERELLRTAQEGDYDMLILGSAWAQPSIKRLMLKNITRDVLLKTQRPVLVVYPFAQDLHHR